MTTIRTGSTSAIKLPKADLPPSATPNYDVLYGDNKLTVAIVLGADKVDTAGLTAQERRNRSFRNASNARQYFKRNPPTGWTHVPASSTADKDVYITSFKFKGRTITGRVEIYMPNARSQMMATMANSDVVGYAGHYLSQSRQFRFGPAANDTLPTSTFLASRSSRKYQVTYLAACKSNQIPSRGATIQFDGRYTGEPGAVAHDLKAFINRLTNAQTISDTDFFTGGANFNNF